MRNIFIISLCVSIILAMVALALVWPQGEGARSPAPFGHPIILPDRFRAEKEAELRRTLRLADLERQKARAEARKAAAKTQDRAVTIDDQNSQSQSAS